MKPWLAALLSLPLAACFSDQRTQMAKCQVEANAIAPDSSDFLRNERQVRLCMEGAGYRRDLAHRICEPTMQMSVALNMYCYVPSGRVARWVYFVEMHWDGTPP